MSADWPEFQLSEKCTIKSSTRIFKKEYVETGVPFMRSKDVIDKALGVFSHFELFISKERFQEIKNKYGFPKKGDLLISSVGNRSGWPYIVQDEGDFYFKDGNVIWMSEFDDLDPDFLAYWMKSDIGQSALASIMIGSAQKAITIDSLRKLWVRFPPFEYQQRSSDILKLLDKQIAGNKATNQTLEQIAQAIFKSWFVDFDPVKAKIETLAAGGSAEDAELAAMRVISAKTVDELNSLKASNPEQFNKLAQTAALFPAAMQDSELGEIPEGWELKRLKDILELAYGKALKKTVRVDGDVPVYGSGGLTGYHNQSLVEGPGIIVGRKGTVGSVYWEPKAFHPIDTVFYVKPRAGYSLKYCHLVLQNLGLKDMNTDAAVPGLNRDNAYRLDVITPTKGVMNLFKEIMQSLQSNVDANNAQSASLESLRDTLLPKLLSGEIDLTSEVVE
ncbi:restriction endonuclease subunit S [Vibrio vulnificus]